MLAGAMLGFCALLTDCCQGQGTADPPARLAARPLAPEQARFYRVPLVCPAAPQIGCGSAAKPILLSLEQSEAVSEAWLNRAGTVVAVVWSKPTTRKERSRTLKAVLEERQLTAREVHGREKQEAWNSFRLGRGWYRASNVDRLSEEEARVIAARWVGRIRDQLAVPEQQASALQEGFAAVVMRKLTGKLTREEAAQEMLRVCRERLDEKDVALLREAFKADLNPEGRNSSR